MSLLRRITAYGLAYLLWLASLVLSGLALFQVRDAYLSAVTVGTFKNTQGDASAQFYAALQVRSMDQWSYLLMGGIMIVLIVFLENYYRGGVSSGRLRLRFFAVTTITFAILLVAELTSAAMVWVVGGFTWRSLYYPILELISGAIFLWLWLDSRRRVLSAGQPA
jgi:hypothetical protein